MCEYIANEGNDCTDCCLADNAVGRSVHLDEKCNCGQCTYGPANRGEDQMLNAERRENVATRHDEKAGEPRPAKLFNGRTDKPACAQIIESEATEVMGCHFNCPLSTAPPANVRETEVLNLVRCRFDHVSTERLVSGPGLVALYRALNELDGIPAAPFSSAEIADPKVGGNDTRAVEALEMFCAMLGTAAGNLALTLGAQGGIYIAGGIVPGLGASFHQSTFRRSFEGKGRFHDYLSKIPTYVITRSLPALLGAAHLLRAEPLSKAAQAFVEWATGEDVPASSIDQ